MEAPGSTQIGAHEPGRLERDGGLYLAQPGSLHDNGTASTMTSIAEALEMMLPGCAAVPAVDSRRYAIAEASGRRIVEMVKEDLRPTRILTSHAFENAIRLSMALGGSTNVVIHLVAVAGRLAGPSTSTDSV